MLLAQEKTSRVREEGLGYLNSTILSVGLSNLVIMENAGL